MSKRILRHKWVKPLVEEAKRLGYKVKLVPNSSHIGIKDALGVHIEGELMVVLKDHTGVKMSIADIAWVLAHEVRHAQHVKTGGFEKYYSNRRIFGYTLEYGHRAEMNCDQFADNYVDALPDLRIKPRFYKRIYPIYKVAGFPFFEIQRKNPGVPHKELLALYAIERMMEKGKGGMSWQNGKLSLKL